tara:strand:- start:310 stop:762 length:453 start_codon:yes stop_codon:yes gene_type:complete
MGTLTSKLTLTGSSADYGAAVALSVTKALTVQKPFVGLSKVVVDTTTDHDSAQGVLNTVLPSTDSRRYLYIKHNGIDSTGAATTADLLVKNFEGELSADGTQIMSLKTGEWAFFPYDNGQDPASGDENALVLQASTGTIEVEYSYYTVAD